MRRFVLVLLVLWAPLAAAQTGIEADDIRLELVLEDREHSPYPGEMILLSIRGTYKIPVVRETLLQPALEGFDWMQLGEDRWYKDREDGFEVVKLERRMALFPQRADDIAIPAFTHALEMLARNGQTIPIEVSSNALDLEVDPQPAFEDWWFPVRKFEVSDSWSNQPETLDTGAAALRIVTLTVEGSAPQRIPPMPELTGSGAFIFPHPEQKITALGPDGPVTRVFWRWTVRPEERSAGYLNPIRIAYFDAEARQASDVTLSAQRIAYAEGPQEVRPSENGSKGAPGPTTGQSWIMPHLPGWTVLVAGLLGLLAGAAVLIGSMGRSGWRLPSWIRPDPRLSTLDRAARSGDVAGVWSAAVRLLGPDVPRPENFAQLDRALHAREGSAPDLRAVARSVRLAASTAPDQTS